MLSREERDAGIREIRVIDRVVNRYGNLESVVIGKSSACNTRPHRLYRGSRRVVFKVDVNQTRIQSRTGDHALTVRLVKLETEGFPASLETLESLRRMDSDGTDSKSCFLCCWVAMMNYGQRSMPVRQDTVQTKSGSPS